MVDDPRNNETDIAQTTTKDESLGNQQDIKIQLYSENVQPEDRGNLWVLLMVKYPLQFAASMTLVVAAFLALAAFHPPSIDTSLSNFEARSHIAEVDQAIRLASEESADVFRNTESFKIPGRELSAENDRQLIRWVLTVVYSRRDGSSILDANSLIQVKEIEQRFKQLSDYDAFCTINSEGACGSPDSLLNYLELPVFQIDSINNGHVQLIVENLAKFNVLWYTDSSFNASNLASSYLRSTFFFSVPEGFDGWDDRPGEQEALYKAWICGHLSSLRQFSTEEISVNWGGDYITEYEILDALLGDIQLCLAGLCIMFLYCCIYFDSLLLAIVGILEIACSFPLGYCIYHFVFGVVQIGMLEFLGFFIILGIGIDDIFVFYGSFQVAYAESQADMEKSLLHAFSTAGGSMLVTTATSATAFAASIFSNIPALQKFGLFVSLLVLMNFLLVLSWFPAFLCVWHTYIRGTPVDPTIQTWTKRTWKKLLTIHPNITRLSTEKLHFHCSWKAYFGAIENRKYYCLFLSGASAIVFGAMALQLRPSDEFVRFFPSDHNVQFMSVMLDSLFTINRQLYRRVHPPSELSGMSFSSNVNVSSDGIESLLAGFRGYPNTELLTISWGIDGIIGYNSLSLSQQQVSRRVKYDPNFDLSSERAQQSTVDLCNTLGDNVALVEEVHRCFMKSFSSWTRSNPPFHSMLVSPEAFFPVSEDHFEGAMIHWLESEPYWKSTRDIGYTNTSFPSPSYMKILVRSTMAKKLKTSDTFLEYSLWIDYLKNLTSQNSWSVTPALTSPLLVRMATERAAVDGLFQSLFISTTCTLISVIVFTCSICMSLIAGLTVSGIIAVVMGLMKVPLRWSIGAVESVSLTFLVGLTVDYILHLGKHYLSSKAEARCDRVRDAFVLLGPSIFASAVTTIVGVFPLVFCTIVPFAQVGIIVMLAITTTFLFAFHFFVPALLLLGKVRMEKWTKSRGIQILKNLLMCSPLRIFVVVTTLLLIYVLSLGSLRDLLHGPTTQSGVLLCIYASCISLDISHSIWRRFAGTKE